MTPALLSSPLSRGHLWGARQQRGVQPGPPLRHWGTGGSSAPCPAGRWPRSRLTYRIPHDGGDTVLCQPMPREEGTCLPGPGGALLKPRPHGAQPALPTFLCCPAKQMSLPLFTLLKP